VAVAVCPDGALRFTDGDGRSAVYRLQSFDSPARPDAEKIWSDLGWNDSSEAGARRWQLAVEPRDMAKAREQLRAEQAAAPYGLDLDTALERLGSYDLRFKADETIMKAITYSPNDRARLEIMLKEYQPKMSKTDPMRPEVNYRLKLYRDQIAAIRKFHANEYGELPTLPGAYLRTLLLRP
jgi:hypothetical protein